VHFTHKRQAHNDASVGVHRFIDRPDGLSKLRARLRPLPRFRFNFPPAKAVYDLWHIFPWATMLTRHDAARRGASRRGIPDDDEINGAPATWIWNSPRCASGKAVLGSRVMKLKSSLQPLARDRRADWSSIWWSNEDAHLLPSRSRSRS